MRSVLIVVGNQARPPVALEGIGGVLFAVATPERVGLPR